MALEILLLCLLICPAATIFALFTALDRGAPPSLRRQARPAEVKERPAVTPLSVATPY
jgi:hypothetical protein